MGGFLSDLTLFSTFICLVLTLWFAIYLLSRSRGNPVAFRTIFALVALSIYYIYLLNALVAKANEKNSVRLFAITVALIASHELTHYMLNPQQRKKYYPLARGIVLAGIIVIILIFTTPRAQTCDPFTICPTQLGFPNLVIELFNVLIFCVILFNLWMIRKSEGLLNNLAFYLAVFVGIGAVTFSFIGTVLNIVIPRILPNFLILAALVLLFYSVAHDRTFVTHRTSTYDLPVTLLTIIAIATIYVLVGRELKLSGINLAIIVILAVFTHAVYDLVRDTLDQVFYRQQRRMRNELDTLGREVSTQESLQRYLSRSLAILCKNMNTLCGFIAIRQENQFVVAASFHSLHVGESLLLKDVAFDGHTPSTSPVFPNITWFAPGYSGSEQIAVIGIGRRKDKIAYSEEDLYWLEDIAHEIGRIANFQTRTQTVPIKDTGAENEFPGYVTNLPMTQGDLLSALAYKLDINLLKYVEDGFQHLNDYDELGKSPLVDLFGIVAGDHLECGKLVQSRLIHLLEKLKPVGSPPPEPLPREWYAYTILHDSYVDNCLSRDVMGKLYIGEGTYYRIRRQALRSISRVVQEMGVVTGRYDTN